MKAEELKDMADGSVDTGFVHAATQSILSQAMQRASEGAFQMPVSFVTRSPSANRPRSATPAERRRIVNGLEDEGFRVYASIGGGMVLHWS